MQSPCESVVVTSVTLVRCITVVRKLHPLQARSEWRLYGKKLVWHSLQFWLLQMPSSVSSQSLSGFHSHWPVGWGQARPLSAGVTFQPPGATSNGNRPGTASAVSRGLSALPSRYSVSSSAYARLAQQRDQLQAQISMVEQQLVVCELSEAATAPAQAQRPQQASHQQRAHRSASGKDGRPVPTYHAADAFRPVIPGALDAGRYAFWPKALRGGGAIAPSQAQRSTYTGFRPARPGRAASQTFAR